MKPLKPLLEIFNEAKEMPKMGQGKILLIMDMEEGFAGNVTMLDPYLKTVTLGRGAISYTDVQASKIKAAFV